MSKLEVLSPLFRFLPEVSGPKRHVSFREKLLWSIVVLSVYFALAQIPLYGLSAQATDWLASLRTVLAGNSGSILHLGIGPVVTAGIVMQLLVGSDLIDLDITSHQGKEIFQGTQKLLAIALCVFEAFAMVRGQGLAQEGFFAIVVFQMALGGILVLIMDEVVTKWGFGSGISLFIAGRVSAQIIWRSFSFLGSEAVPGQLIGGIPQFIKSFIEGNPVWRRTGSSLVGMDQIAFTVVIFLIVVYMESIRVEIPLSYGKYKGIRGRYPIRFIYASNIPMILTWAMFSNVVLMARVLSSRGITWLGTFQGDNAVSGLVKYLQPPRGIESLTQTPFEAIVYLLIVVALCIFFAVLWVELTQMGPEAVAKKLQRSGMQIPGFRKDPRILKKVLSRYIPQVTVMGGATVGLIATMADFTGAVGTGTGILLTVGIVYRLYEELMKEQMSEMFPALRRFIGE